MGNPKILTPGPVRGSPQRTGSAHHPTDQSMDYPYGPPLRTTLKWCKNNK